MQHSHNINMPLTLTRLQKIQLIHLIQENRVLLPTVQRGHKRGLVLAGVSTSELDLRERPTRQSAARALRYSTDRNSTNDECRVVF